MEGQNNLISGDRDIYRFHQPNVTGLGTFEYSLQDIIDGKRIDGLVIRNVLQQEEVTSVLDTFKKNPALDKVHRDEVTIYPKGFAAFLDEKNVTIEDYYRSGKEYNQGFSDSFGVDIFNKLKQIFGTLSGLNVDVIKSSSGETPFGQIRDLYSGKSGMPLHCGRVFQDFYRGFYSYMDGSIDYKVQLSYFILLQETEAGGELVLIDRHFEEGQQMKPFDEMIEKNGEVVNIHDPSVRKMVIQPKVGDMVLFNGSSIWHKVGDIKGDSDRITFGGFMGFKAKTNELLLWA